MAIGLGRGNLKLQLLRLVQTARALCALGLSLLLLVGAAGAGSAWALNPDADDWVRVRDGHFTLHGKSWMVKGVNYIGSWRHKMTIDAGKGVEHFTIWALYHDFDNAALAADFDFLRDQLNATAVRMAAPAAAEFENLVRYHGYAPWYGPDGSISDPYRRELVTIADTANAHGLRVHFCLLWNIGNEIAADLDAFAPGGRLDAFYSAQVRSIAAALASHQGVFAFSVGNEVLVNWPINGTHRSAFESVAANFVARRIADIRAVAPRQLVTEDELMQAKSDRWYAPGPEFVDLLDETADGGVKAKRIAELVDYFGPHFYPVTLKPEELVGGFPTKLDDSKRQLAIYAAAARAAGKPVVLDEFGLGLSPLVSVSGEKRYGPFRDAYFAAIVQAAQADRMQGALAWGAVPIFHMAKTSFELSESELNPYSPLEINLSSDSASLRKILFYVPSFELFTWPPAGNVPSPTQSARTLSKALQ
jgi:hypothetical protein